MTLELLCPGLAFLASVCLKSKVGILEDDGFSLLGVHTAAHELAHVLGCPHDGEPAPRNLPNSPGSTSCSQSDGFLMGSTFTGPKNKNMYHLSTCCQEMIRYVAGQPDYDCLRTKKLQKDLQTSRLPGSFTTPNETCEMKLRAHNLDGGFHEDKDGMMEQCLLYCKTIPDKDGNVWNVNVTAEEGTPCSNAKPPKVCIAEECVVGKSKP